MSVTSCPQTTTLSTSYSLRTSPSSSKTTTISSIPQPLLSLVVGTSLYDSTFPKQLGYTSYLKRVTPDFSLPFIVSVDVYQLDHSLQFYIVINTMHLSDYQSMQHTHYSLQFQHSNYSNQFDRKNSDIGYSVLKFVVPINTPFNRNQQISFFLIFKTIYPTISSLSFDSPILILFLLECVPMYLITIRSKSYECGFRSIVFRECHW